MIPRRMRVAYMKEEGRIELETVDVPRVLDHQVLVRIRAVGICASDVHLFSHAVTSGGRIPLPYILGHEASGEIVATGKLVTGLKEGDRVVMEPGALGKIVLIP